MWWRCWQSPLDFSRRKRGKLWQEAAGSWSAAQDQEEDPQPPLDLYSKSAQTDEEKQRERQRNEREQQNAQIEAQNFKRERDAREARQLDLEIRRQHEREARQAAHLESTRKKEQDNQKLQNQNQPASSQVHTQLPQAAKSVERGTAPRSTTVSCERTLPADLKPSKSHSTERKSQTPPDRTASSSVTDHATASSTDTRRLHPEQQRDGKSDSLTSGSKERTSTTPSPQTVTAAAPTHVAAATIPAAAASIGIIALRDDSTESDQSITYSQSHSETIHRLMCRAPIASLDCMEEFSGTGHLDFGRSISLGSNPALPMRHSSNTTPGLRYKNLGKSGLRVSNVGLGTWPVFSSGVPEDQAEAIIRLAMESGINLFDISEAHSEAELGKILQKCAWKRTTFVVSTKIYWSTKSEERGLSRKHIIESVKASLQRLQLQYIDIVIIHKADSMCPMEEVVRAMNYVISQGWAMYWGTARWSPVEIMEAYTNCRQFNCITPIVEQAEYHMFNREKAELYLPEMYNKIGVGLMAWGPLSMALGDTQNGERIFFTKGSFKTKSHSYSWTEDEANKESFGWSKERLEEGRRQVDKIRDIATLAEKLGCTAAQLSIAWSLKHEPVQCLLISAITPEQLHQSLQALQLLPRLSTAVMLELERLLDNKPVRPPPISTLALR